MVSGGERMIEEEVIGEEILNLNENVCIAITTWFLNRTLAGIKKKVTVCSLITNKSIFEFIRCKNKRYISWYFFKTCAFNHTSFSISSSILMSWERLRLVQFFLKEHLIITYDMNFNIFPSPILYEVPSELTILSLAREIWFQFYLCNFIAIK